MEEFFHTEIEKYLLGFAIFTSILSFSSNSSISGICGVLMYLFWGATLIYKFFLYKLQINTIIKYMIFVYVLFYVLSKMFYFLGFYPSSGSGVTSNLLLCAIFYLIGYNCSCKKDGFIEFLLYMAFGAYFILTCTSMIMINDLEDSVIWNKNQLGQMLGSAIIYEALILPRKTNKKFIIGILYLSGIISLIVLMRLHSRTPLIAIAVVCIINFIQKKNKKEKDYLIAALVIVMLCLVIKYLGGIEFLKDLFEVDDTTNISSEEGLNDITSGRISKYRIALNDFFSSPVIGVGAYAYIDNFVLCTLRTGGIFLAIFILPYVYGMLFTRFKRSNNYLRNNTNKMDNVNTIMFIVKCFSVYFFVISLMEGYPPLGPGTSTFLLWLFIGMGDSVQNGGILSNER